MCSRGVYIPTNQTAEDELLNGPSFLRVNSFVDDDASKVVGKYHTCSCTIDSHTTIF